MTEQVSPLRQRMIDDMTIRNMSPNTQKAYIRAVKNFSQHFGESPDKLTFEDVRAYQLHLVSRGLQAATIIPIMCAIRFFYGTTLGRPNVAEHIPLARKADTLPAILTRDQVVRFLKAVPDLEMRTTVYHHLLGRPARLRGRRADGARYRQCEHGHPRAARQRSQGPLCHAVRTTARDLARLLEVWSARICLVPRLSRARPGQTQSHAACRGRVHTPPSDARAPRRLPPHPALRPVRQRASRGKACPVSNASRDITCLDGAPR
jgi:integrase/recombinase XerD